MERILVIGALGQIGSELVPALRAKYGSTNVLASDIAEPLSAELRDGGPFLRCDVTNRDEVTRTVTENGIDAIVNLAALLSAVGERSPLKAWQVNMDGLLNVLEVSREFGLDQVFCPSSIAAFGPSTPRDNTPQSTILEPTTIYGITKVSGELLCNYYWHRFNVDARGLRYPGIISSETPPGGGTTDYAVDIFYKALADGRYSCFLREDTMLPMMYMPDCIKATLELMDAPRENLSCAANYNVAAVSFTPGQLAAEIRRHLPDFAISYMPDERQAYADSWPKSIDDSVARRDWGWQPDYGLSEMTADMLARLGARANAAG